ncbi:MAG: M48 family metalloprotease [Armatimonadota bacterium]
MRRADHSIFRLAIIFCMLSMGVAAPNAVYSTTLKEEIDLGKKLDVEITKETPMSTDRAGQKEIKEVGQKLVKYVNRTEIPYHFKILQDKELNAFSIPGGYVYFSERLWNVLRPNERAGVLAHEIVHVDRRHALDAMSKAQRRTIFLGVLLGALGANNTVGSIADLANSLYTLKYSRGDEQQADTVGVELLQKASDDPAGLLLAMRKINRFQADSGGEPPKIFNSHPPTPERLKYLTELLVKMGVPVPPDNAKEMPNEYTKIGTVTSVKGDTIQFTATKAPHVRSIVWLMGQGWDYRYENKTTIPVARGVVTAVGSKITATIWSMPNAKAKDIAKDVGVYEITTPSPVSGVAEIVPTVPGSTATAKLSPTAGMQKLERLLAIEQVWDDESGQLTNDKVGYVVITKPSNENGFVSLTRPKYSYAPVEAGSILIKINDPDQNRWVGTVISVGKSSQAVEVLANRTIERGTKYEIAFPGWDPKVSYDQRVVGRASLKSSNGKLVLQITSLTPGWNMADIRNGFDIYEEGKTNNTDDKDQ